MKRGAVAFRRVPLHLAVALALLAGASLVRGNRLLEKGRIAIPVEADVAKTPAPDAATTTDEAIQGEFPNGAGLKTDPELESTLKLAETYAADGRLDLAAILWQRVLDESGHTVITRPEWSYRSMEGRYRKYKSLSEEIEKTVAKLSDTGMRQYRLTADGEAKAILAAGTGALREEALAEVVRKYFMSSQGDDAAFELGCLRLDRHDFVGAGRLFSKILVDYPDSSIPRGEVLLRLALTNVRVGDAAAARTALTQLQQLDAGASLARGISFVQGEIDRGGNSESATQTGQDWHLAWGSPERTGHMPALPEAVTSATLSESWSEDFEMESGSLASNNDNNDMRRGRVVFGGMAKASYMQFPQQPGQVLTRDALLQRWKSGGWRPAGQMLLHGGLVYYKRHDRVVCRDSATGDLKWMSRPSVYEGDMMAQWRINMQRAYGMNPQASGPAAPQETFLFSDRLQQAMTICDGVMYTIDGPLEGEAMGVRKGNDQMAQMNWQNIPRRSRTNFLYAYDAINGKFKWLRAADGSEDGSKFEVGFMAAPVPYARFLLVPVSDSGTQSLMAIEKSTGDIVWKTFLCEDPSGASSACSPVGVTVAGGDAYVSTGGGVVFAIDAMSGAIRWAVRYQRTSKGSIDMARFGIPQQQLIDVDGWEEDVVIPHAKSLVVMPSDCDKLFALDRRTGELLWESPRKPAADDDPAQYCLGVLEDGLFVAGHKSVRRYDLTKDGRLMWEAKLEPSFGHGVLTADAIYMPVGETVARIDPQTGKRTAQVGVFSPSKEPAGNLFSDGKRLLAVGLARAYSLQDLQSRLAGLGERIAAGDSQAQLQRMRLRLRAQEHDNALADLKEACERMVKQNGGIQANRTLYDGIGELDLVNRDAKLTLALLVDAQSRLTPQVQSAADKPNLEQLLGQRDGIVLGALRKIKADSTPGAAEHVLAVAAIVEKPNLLAAAREALKVTAAEANADLLRQAVASENPRQKIVAMASLTKALGDAASEPLLVGLLDDASPEVQLSAALALSDRGDRRALSSLGKLLDAEDLQIRSRASVALRALTGQKFKYMAYEKPENRAAAAQEWRTWIAGEGQTAKLNFPIADSRSMLGRTLLAVYAQNKVMEIDHERKMTWEINNIVQPWGVEGLANGHRLVSSLSGQFVVEYDESGKECWRKDGLPGNVAHAHRLEDGNTLLAIANLNKVMEIDSDGKTVWEATIEGYPQDARRLDNGNTLIPLQQAQKVVEIDRSGKVIWEAANMQGPFSARRLDNGNTLIAQSGAGQVVEVDRDGKTVWQQQGLSSPYDAQRLDNGNTLITDTAGYREVDADNKVIWQENLNGVLRIDRY